MRSSVTRFWERRDLGRSTGIVGGLWGRFPLGVPVGSLTSSSPGEGPLSVPPAGDGVALAREPGPSPGNQETKSLNPAFYWLGTARARCLPTWPGYAPHWLTLGPAPCPNVAYG